MRFKTLITILITCFIYSWASSAWADVSIETSIQPSKVAVGEPLELSISITGVPGSIQTPKLPELNNFMSYSQGHSEEVTIVNGVSTNRTVFTYVLIPNAAGNHQIAPMEIAIGNKVYRTGSLQIEVTPDSKNWQQANQPGGGPGKPHAQVVPASSGQLPPELMTGQEIFVRTWADRDEAYINQPIYLTYTLYTRVSATFKGFEDEPETTGFWVEDFPPQGMATRHEKDIAGYRYIIADVRSIALFPTQTGDFTIKPGSLKVDAEIVQQDQFNQFYSRDVFGRRRYNPRPPVINIEPRVLETETLPVKIKPLPEEGKPESFNGAVGHFQLSAKLDTNEVDVGQPVKYTIKLAGEGNINTVQLPKLPLINYFKFYDSSSQINLKKDRYIVEGEKSTETVFVPKQAGTYIIPATEFSYFDPAKEKYVVLATKELKLVVKGGPEEPKSPGDAGAQQAPIIEEPIVLPESSQPQPEAVIVPEIKTPEREIRYVQLTPGTPRTIAANPLHQRSFWVWSIALFVLGLVMFLIGWIAALFGKDTSAAKLRKSHQMARKFLNSAHACLKKGHEKEFYEALSKCVHNYFSAKLNVEIGAVGVTMLEERLQGKASAQEMAQIKSLMSEIDFARFSRSSSDLDTMKRIYQDADNLIAMFERKRLK